MDSDWTFAGEYEMLLDTFTNRTVQVMRTLIQDASMGSDWTLAREYEMLLDTHRNWMTFSILIACSSSGVSDC